MALSGLFLITFLSLHLAINLASVFSVELYNEWSHFMGYNKIVQLIMQPILIAGVIVHFVMGFVLEVQNRAARGAQGYAVKGRQRHQQQLDLKKHDHLWGRSAGVHRASHVRFLVARDGV